jgi:cell division septal protein FtsQ
MHFTARQLKIAIILLLVLLPVEYLVFFHKPSGKGQEIRIIFTSDINLSEDEIFKLINIDRNSHFNTINVNEISNRLTQNINVDSVSVEKRWPNRLYITLSAYNAVASFINGRGELQFLNEEGTVFTTLAQNEAIPPLIEGLINRETEGESLSISAPIKAFLTDLALLKNNKNQFYRLISIITIIKKHNNAVATLVSFNNFNNNALWPLRIDENRFYNNILVFSLLKELNILSGETLDFRTDEMVFSALGEEL